MKRIIATAVGVVVGALFLATGSALADDSAQTHIKSDCSASAFYVNTEDEVDRLPGDTEDGLVFDGSDLIHHETDVALADLNHGTFTASPAPDQNSFFSVEISDPDGAYGTLRWNMDTSMWDLTTNLDQFHKANPADYIGVDTKWGKITDKTRVFSFGVGYTANPPGTVKTTVSKITFGGKDYDLTCKPPVVTPSSSSPAPTKKPTKKPGSGVHTTPNPPQNGPSSETGALAVTGSSTGPMVAIGGVVILGGGLAIWASRRRKTRFTA